MAHPRRLGLALLGVGLVLLGWVGWELVGTTVVAQREQDRVAGAVQETWDGGTLTPERRALAEDVVALVRVPAFGRDWVVPAYAGTGPDVLDRGGLGVFASSPAPGGDGNLALTGHRVTHGQPLDDLPDLGPGDEVVVETEDTIATYELTTRPERVDDADTWVADDAPGRDLTLVTCAELFHTADRLVVFGRLLDTEQRSP